MFYYFVTAGFIVAAVSTCGTHKNYYRYKVSSCTTEQLADGSATISCTDGTKSVVSAGRDGLAGRDGRDGEDGKDGKDGKDGLAGQDGKDGEDGLAGQDGKDAEPCYVEPFYGGATIVCADSSVDIVDGESITGPVGPAGGSCTVASVIGGALISCEDGSSELITDGQNAILEIIDPCGDNPGQFDEVLFRLSSGEVVAYFEQGSKRFLTVLNPGNYRTTDTQNCNFTITEDMQVEYD